MNRRDLLFGTAALAAAGVATKSSVAAPSPVDAAKAVVADHEAKAESGVLDDIAKNFSKEIVLFAPGMQMVQGIDAFKVFYQSLLDMGTWKFGHDYLGHDADGETVILYGVARGTLEGSNGEEPVSFANNFLLVMKPEDGQYKIRRCAFAPNA